jgi:phospholipase/carboxylesterase
MPGNSLETLQIDTGPEPGTAVLWLHGLGADGHDFEPLIPMLRIPADTPMRFVFPHAPVRPVTLNGGMRMRAWYDLLALTPGPRESAEDLREAVAMVAQLGRELQDHHHTLILGGFSQGGAVALLASLATSLHPDAVFALSAYLPDTEAAGLALAPDPRTKTVFQAHGLSDPIIPLEAGRAAAHTLRHLGLQVEYHEYPMAHQVCEAEVIALRAWLLRAARRD